MYTTCVPLMHTGMVLHIAVAIIRGTATAEDVKLFKLHTSNSCYAVCERSTWFEHEHGELVVAMRMMGPMGWEPPRLCGDVVSVTLFPNTPRQREVIYVVHRRINGTADNGFPIEVAFEQIPKCRCETLYSLGVVNPIQLTMPDLRTLELYAEEPETAVTFFFTGSH